MPVLRDDPSAEVCAGNPSYVDGFAPFVARELESDDAAARSVYGGQGRRPRGYWLLCGGDAGLPRDTAGPRGSGLSFLLLSVVTFVASGLLFALVPDRCTLARLWGAVR